MFCPSCGKQLAEGQVFCTACGARLPAGPATPMGRAAFEPPAVEYAGFWRRFAASIIDNIILGIPMSILWVLIFVPLGLTAYDETAFFGAMALLVIAGPLVLIGEVLYFALMESSSRQATLGKMALGIIVTDGAGKRISFGKAIGRYFSKTLSALILYIGYIMIASTGRKQGLHDMIVDTLVVLK